MKNILIPTDFSENSLNAMRYAIGFFNQEACNFYVLHALPVMHNSVSQHNYSDTFTLIPDYRISQELDLLIKQLKECTTNAQHRFFPIQKEQLLVEAIRNQVAEKAIDYIVMGTKGISGLQEVAVGSNTGEVITKVKCPVLMIPEKAKFTQVKEITIPTDYYMIYNSKVLNTLTEILSLHKAKLRILNVQKREIPLSTVQQENRDYLDAHLDSSPHSFHNMVNPKIEIALQDFILDYEINLIAMVAKNLNFFQRLLFEPMVKQISYHTEIPVLILHE
ncbi:MAG: universal stress protein [Leeuwenhoekiella sp.]